MEEYLGLIMEDFLKKQFKGTIENLLKNTKASDIGVDERTFQHCKNLVLVMLGQQPNPNSNMQSTQNMFDAENRPHRTISFKTIPFVIEENGEIDRTTAMSMINKHFEDNPNHRLVNIETLKNEHNKEHAFRFFFVI